MTRHVHAVCTKQRSEAGLAVRFNLLSGYVFDPAFADGAGFAWRGFSRRAGGSPMDLWVWLPLLFVLGIATMAALFAFVLACAKV